MKKRILVLILACVMVFTLVLAGCVVQEEEPAEEGEEKVESKEPDKISYLCHESQRPQYPYSESPVLDIIEEIANVEVEYITAPMGNATKQLAQTTLASGVNLPDMVVVEAFNQIERANLAETGMAVALSPYFEEYAPNYVKNYVERFPQDYLRQLMPDGKMYWMGGAKGDVPSHQISLLIRENWLEKFDIELPETIDEFYSMLRTFQDRDANENGRKDEIWTTAWGNFLHSTSAAFGAGVLDFHPSESFIVDDNGNLFNSYASPNTKKWLEWIQKVYKEGLLDPDIVVINSGKTLFSKVADNIVSAADRPPYQLKNFVPALRNKGYEDARYTWTWPLAGPEGHQACWRNSAGISNQIIVTKDSEHPEACVRWVDAFYSEKGIPMFFYGVPGEDWVRRDDGTIDSTVFFEKKKENTDYPWMCGQGYSDVPKFKVFSWEDYAKVREAFVPLGFDLDRAKKYDEFCTPLQVNVFAPGIPVNEERQLIEEIDKDLWVYMDEMLKKFVTCNASLDEWDNYIEKCNELGLDKATEAYQMMHERLQSLK